MKIRLTFKTPDVVEDAMEGQEYTDEQKAAIASVCRKYVEYGEYVTISLDTDTGTAKVVPLGD